MRIPQNTIPISNKQALDIIGSNEHTIIMWYYDPVWPNSQWHPRISVDVDYWRYIISETNATEVRINSQDFRHIFGDTIDISKYIESTEAGYVSDFMGVQHLITPISEMRFEVIHGSDVPLYHHDKSVIHIYPTLDEAINYICDQMNVLIKRSLPQYNITFTYKTN